jgi:hypothetical protein
MAYVWDHSQQTGTNLLMMLAIADMANDAGRCWPTMDRLAQKCRMERRQAQYLIKHLVEVGELLVEHGRGRGYPSIYVVKGAAECTLSGPAEEKVQSSAPFLEEKVQSSAPFPEMSNEKVQSSAPFLEEKVQSSAPFPEMSNEKVQSSAPFSAVNQELLQIQDLQDLRLKTRSKTRKDPKQPIPPPPSSSEEAIELATITSAEAFVALYNANIPPGIPMAKTLSPERRQRIEKRLKDFPDRLFWLTCFRAPANSAFLRGERNGPGHPRFKFTLNFLLSKKDGIENCVKVYEGNYADDPPQEASQPDNQEAMAALSPRMQDLTRQAQQSAQRMKNDPRWNPALRKDVHEQP